MRTLTAAAPPQLRLRVRVAAALLATLFVASLLAPVGVAAKAVTWLVPSGTALPAGAQVLDRIAVADALLVTSPTAPAGAVRADTALSFKSLDLASDTTPLDAGATSTGARQAWAEGQRGDGAVVALIDTGVAPLTELGDIVAGEIDFTGEGGGDGYGHGTFMASLIAGDSELAPGVAPDALVLSLKVGGADGSTTLGAVLKAMDWVAGPGRRAGVRIASLALGVDAGTDAARILDGAADRLARSDVLVVTAAGNDGPDELTSPATATQTFSVGAYDPLDAHAVDPDDAATRPAAAWFSATGTDRAGVAQPDVLAAGMSVAGHLPADSEIGEAHSDDLVHGTILRGSGTSMATALAAGVAALASGAAPRLGGTALDIALRNPAATVHAPSAIASARLLDEIADQPRDRVLPERANGNANGHARANGGNGNGTANGNAHGHSVDHQIIRWKGNPWSIIRWKDGAWQIIRWKGEDWQIIRWKAEDWQIIRWKAEDWQIIRWKADDWQIIRWKAVDWNGSGWGDATWQAASLGGAEFDGDSWRIIRWKAEHWGDAHVALTTIRWKSDAWTMLTDAG